MMAEAARICVGSKQLRQLDEEFYAHKLSTAEFYARQMLPRTGALRASIIDGAACVAGLSTALFS